LQELEAELERYYCSSPYSVRRYNDMERGRHIIKVDLVSPSDRLYLLVGDFSYCLRCALDHVVYALIAAATQTAPPASVQWPVLIQSDEKQLRMRTRDMHPGATHLIDQLQPYQHGNFKLHPIWQLHRLNNIDKHRRLSRHENWLDMHFPELKPTDDVVRDADASEITLPLHLAKTEMRLNPRPAIWFGDREEDVWVDAARLREIHSYITMNVLPLFAPFFVRAVG
jgi:hypothetical protein